MLRKWTSGWNSRLLPGQIFASKRALLANLDYNDYAISVKAIEHALENDREFYKLMVEAKKNNKFWDIKSLEHFVSGLRNDAMVLRKYREYVKEVRDYMEDKSIDVPFDNFIDGAKQAGANFFADEFYGDVSTAPSADELNKMFRMQSRRSKYYVPYTIM